MFIYSRIMYPMNRIVAAVAAFLLICISGVASAATPLAVRFVASPAHQVPVPTTSLTTISTEFGYSSFPVSVELNSGAVLTAYGVAPTHDGPTSFLTFRRSLDGRTWRDPETMPLAAGYAWGSSGFAMETVGQGGRLYMTVNRAHYTAGTLDEQRMFLYTSEDEGLTWTYRLMFPTTPGTWGFGPSSILVDATDGSVWISGYSSDGVTRLMRSTDRGLTVTNVGTIAVSGRSATSPHLGQLDDGRLFMILRSDSPGLSSRLYATTKTGSAWSTPNIISYDATTLGGVTVLAGGTIAILYRGWSDRTDDGPSFRPMRLALAEVNTSGVIVMWRSNVDPSPSMNRRFLLGDAVHSASGWLLIWGVEGPNPTATAASVVALAIDWVEVA